MDLAQQSAIGFRPSTDADVPLNTTFLLGRMEHRNNPIINSEQISTSSLGIEINGTDLGSFGWSLDETPNQCSGANCSDDITTLTSTVSGSTLNVGGIEYNLIIKGFTKQGSTCDTLTGSVATTWQTVEGQTNYGCLWGELRQVRPLTIKKVANGQVDPPAFSFTSTSNRTGSVWSTSPWNLNPAGEGLGGAASKSDVIYAGSETVTVTEDNLPGWALTNIECTGGTGITIGSDADYDVGDTTVTLANLPAVPAAQRDRLHLHEHQTRAGPQRHQERDLGHGWHGQRGR